MNDVTERYDTYDYHEWRDQHAGHENHRAVLGQAQGGYRAANIDKQLNDLSFFLQDVTRFGKQRHRLFLFMYMILLHDEIVQERISATVHL